MKGSKEGRGRGNCKPEPSNRGPRAQLLTHALVLPPRDGAGPDQNVMGAMLAQMTVRHRCKVRCPIHKTWCSSLDHAEQVASPA